jgi:hypothetical protein
MKKFGSIGEIIDRLAPPLSESELSHIGDLSRAINHAITVAENTPSTLDGRARALIITKLQEAEHWTIELLRAVPRPRGNPTQ